MKSKKTPVQFKFPVVYKLKVPVNVAGQEITELTFREPLNADIYEDVISFEEATHSQFMNLASRLSGQPDAIFKKMSARDGLVVRGLMDRFFVPYLEMVESELDSLSSGAASVQNS